MDYVLLCVFRKFELKTPPIQEHCTEFYIKPIILGELTSDESSTLDKLIKFGLGFGIDQSINVQVKEEIDLDIELRDDGIGPKTKGNTDDSTAPEGTDEAQVINRSELDLTCECRIQVAKLKLGKNEQVKVISELLEALLTSKYRHDGDSSSDKTMDVKPKFVPIALKPMRKTKMKEAQIMPCKHWVIHSKPSRAKGGFKITLHSLARRQPKYYFKCYVSGCSSKFHSLKDWNTHHIVQHKTMLSFLKCPRQLKKLSAFRAHLNNHALAKLTCSTYGKSFTFPSSVQLHCRVHLTQKIFKCFTAGGKKQYKWRQDLHRHIQKHLK